MKKSEVEIGKTYAAKVSNRLVPVRLTDVHYLGGWYALNLTTAKTIRVKTAARLRYEVERDDGRWKPVR